MAILDPVFVVWVFISFASTRVDAECCINHGWNYCDSWCCGCGSCNIFCCNCAAGCNLKWWHNSIYIHITSSKIVYDPTAGKDWTHWLELQGHSKSCTHRRKRLITPNIIHEKSNSHKFFKIIDLDDSNTICLGEAHAYFKDESNIKSGINSSHVEEHMKMMDKNKDGVISLGEFDNDLDQ